MSPEDSDAAAIPAPQHWRRSALVRWGFSAIAVAMTGLGLAGVTTGAPFPRSWGFLVLAVLYAYLAYQGWREPVFTICHEGVRWPGSKGVVAWSEIKPFTVPPDDGWTHTVFIDTLDGRQHVLPTMRRDQVEALAERIRRTAADPGTDSSWERREP